MGPLGVWIREFLCFASIIKASHLVLSVPFVFIVSELEKSLEEAQKQAAACEWGPWVYGLENSCALQAL